MAKQRFFQPSPEPTIMTVCTWATTPNAADFSGRRIRVTDLGVGGVDMISNGTRWVPCNEHFIHDYFAISLVKAPTLTSVTQGLSDLTIVLGTAMNTTFAKCFMYFAAGQLWSNAGGNAAGFYYTEMSDTTNAEVFSDTYTPAAGVRPTVPTVAAPITGKTAATGGALAGHTSAVTFFTTSIPAGVLGPRGLVLTDGMFEAGAANANAKSTGIVFGGTTVVSQALASAKACFGRNIIRNRATNEQRCSPGYQNTTNNGTVYTASVDTDSAVTVNYTFIAGTATDWVACSGVYVELEVFL